MYLFDQPPTDVILAAFVLGQLCELPHPDLLWAASCGLFKSCWRSFAEGNTASIVRTT